MRLDRWIARSRDQESCASDGLSVACLGIGCRQREGDRSSAITKYRLNAIAEATVVLRSQGQNPEKCRTVGDLVNQAAANRCLDLNASSVGGNFLTDGWDQPFHLRRQNGDDRIVITSPGPDQILDTADDLRVTIRWTSSTGPTEITKNW